MVSESAVGMAGARAIVDRAGTAMGTSSAAGLGTIAACCCWSIPTSKSLIRFDILVAGTAAGATAAGGAVRVGVGITSLVFLVFGAVMQADLSKCFDSGGRSSITVLWT